MEEQDAVSAFEVLENDYQETLRELSGRNSEVVEPFRAEYEKLFKALVKSHESEKRLIKKCRDLNAEIMMNSQNVQTALKLSQEDQANITQLRKDIETQQEMVEQSQIKEKQAKEQIQQYKDEIQELLQKMEQGAGMSVEQETQLIQLKGQKESLEKDRDMLKEHMDMLLNVASECTEKVQRAQAARLQSEERIADIKQRVANKRAEVESEKRRKEELEQSMKDLRLETEQQQEEVAGSQRAIATEDGEVKNLEQDIAETERDEHSKEARVRFKMDERQALEKKLDQELAKNSKYVQENLARELSLRKKKEEIEQHGVEKDKLLKLHDALKKKERAIEDERRQLESERNTLKEELKSMQEHYDRQKKDGDVDSKKIEDLLRERDILNKLVIKADERTKKQIDVVKRQETQAMNLLKDIGRWKQDAQEFKKRIFELDKQREKYGVELTQANAKYFAALEELKTRDAMLSELKKQIADVQAKRNQQKNLYDAVCMDRNLHAKNLVESNEQIAEMRRKFKIMFHTTTALKEEIREKDRRLVFGHFKQNDIRKYNDKLKDAKEKAHRRMKNLTNIVETLKEQIKKLTGTIQEAEQERQAQQKELEGVIGERDVLGAQLIKRNEELALLYEKIKIQQSTLQKGETQFKERLTKMSELRTEIRGTRTEVSAAKNQVQSVENLKAQIQHLHKTLLREETKAKALQEELENPMNVHRWRELEGSDPATYDMIQKVKSLQKLLISKTEEVVEKDQQIQEKEKLYVQLKNIIARQPGPEVAEQLTWYSQNLKEKTQHMKQMAKELQAYHTQVTDLREDIDRHQKELQATKQAYFQQMRQQRMSQSLMAVSASPAVE